MEFFVFVYFEGLFKGINERNEMRNSEENFNIYIYIYIYIYIHADTQTHTHTHTQTHTRKNLLISLNTQRTPKKEHKNRIAYILIEENKELGFISSII